MIPSSKLIVLALLGICLTLVNGQTSLANIFAKKSDKTRVLAPWNDGQGCPCDRYNPNKGNTCLLPNSHCGYYEECPKCTCIKDGHVGVRLEYEQAFRQGEKTTQCTEECLEGNLDHEKYCKHTAQCMSNLVCSYYQNPLATTFYPESHDPAERPRFWACSCPMNMQWNGTYCASPTSINHVCDTTVGCSDGLFCATTLSPPQTPDADGSTVASDEPASNQRGSSTAVYRYCQECLGDRIDGVLTTKTCDERKRIITCIDGYRIKENDQTGARECQKCIPLNCKHCDLAEDSCTMCVDGYYLESYTASGAAKQSTCSRRRKYNEVCKNDGESECEPPGSICTMSEGVNKCRCRPGYTWNPTASICVHPKANVNVGVNGTCKFDILTITPNDLCNQNDERLQLCTAGLECVKDCPCINQPHCEPSMRCVTPIKYGPRHIYGPPGGKGKSEFGMPFGSDGSSGSGSGDGGSGAERGLISMAAIIGSVALSIVFW